MKIQHIKLIKELALLRKGEGMAPFKLHDKPIIRAIVAHATATQTNSLTNNQMYNFLLTELSHLPKNDSLNALRNALGITSTDKKLSTRRAAFAASIHKHPDTVERYENEALKIVASHLYRRNDLFSRSTSANSESPQLYLQEIETQAKATRAITTLGLSAHLSLGDHGEDFLKTLEFSRRPYLNTAITMNLIPSPRGTAWYRFKLTTSFQGARETFRVAVVLDKSDGEQLMATGLIDDFHQLTPTNPTKDIESIIASSKFILKSALTNSQKLLRLHEVETEEAARLFQSVGKPSLYQCWLLEVIIPPEWQTDDITYEYQSSITLETDTHLYAYWYSPALMYLKKLTIDFSQFPEAHKRQFFLQAFLGHNPGIVQTDQHRYSLQLNRWVLPGHGVILLWQDKT